LPKRGITHNSCPREELHITVAQGRNYTYQLRKEELHITVAQGGITHNSCPIEVLHITVVQGRITHNSCPMEELHITVAQGRNYTYQLPNSKTTHCALFYKHK